MPLYSQEPADPKAFVEAFDRFYSRGARLYDLAVKVLPVWKTWIGHALPHICGERVLEVSFGTGYLLCQFAGRFEAHGIDYNAEMVKTARRNLERCGLPARLCRADVASLPYREACFDTVVCTMALSGFPDAAGALREMRRVLRPGGALVLVDVAPPRDGNPAGALLTRFWKAAGDLIRDMDALLGGLFEYEDREIGGFGSVHLYLCRKPGPDPAPAGATT